MGYWIIVTLIVLGGVLVLISAASIDSIGTAKKPPAKSVPADHRPPGQSERPHDPELRVRLDLFIPWLWLRSEQTLPELDVHDVTIDLHPVRSSMVRDVVNAAELPNNELADSVTAILLGADDFLAGNSLESVLDDLVRLLSHLSDQPAMAVIGSIPNIAPALAATMTGVSDQTISATVEVWNSAVFDLVQTYAAEFVDLSMVPVQLVEVDDGKIPGLILTACPNLPMTAAMLAPACNRAIDRVRLVRAET